MKHEGEILRIEPTRNGFIVRRFEDGAEFPFISPQQRQQGNQRQRAGRQFRVGDIVSFEVQNFRGEDRAVNVAVLSEMKGLSLEWLITPIKTNNQTMILGVTITPNRDNKIPVGLICSLKVNGKSVKEPVENPSTDGYNPIEFEVDLPANSDRTSLVLTIREVGKIPRTFSKVWKPTMPVATSLKVVELSKDGGQTLFYVSPLTNGKQNTPFQDTVEISSNKPVHFCFASQSNDKDEADTTHLFKVQEDGFAKILVNPGKDVKEAIIYFSPKSNQSLLTGPFTVSQLKVQPVELEVKSSEGPDWMVYEVIPTKESKPTQLQNPLVLQVRSQNGSRLAVREIGKNEWQAGSEIEYDLKKTIRLQIKVDSLADSSMSGESCQFILTQKDGVQTESEWFYIRRRFCGTAQDTTA